MVQEFSRDGASETLVLAEKPSHGFLKPQDCGQSESRSPHFPELHLGEWRRAIHFCIAKSRCSRPIS